MTSNPFQNGIEGLEEGGAPAVIVGGFAVVMHGVNRFTGDLNVALDLTSSKGQGTLDSLITRGFESEPNVDPAGLFDSKMRQEWIKQGKRALTLKDQTNVSFTVELFLEPPLPFDRLIADSKVLEAYGRKFRISSLPHLLEMKRLARRPQDVMDIENLELVRSMYDDKGNSLAEMLRLNPPEGVGRERIEDLVNFAKLTPQEKINWLTEMLAALGSFCIFG